MKKKLVVFSGAGISAESGLSTFRDQDGLWEKYPIEEVATPEAWRKNPSLVLEFYNLRRKDIQKAQPNAAHESLVLLEKKYDTTIITQNIDDLHERAGSTKIIHLHGEILKSRSERNHSLVYSCHEDIQMNQKAEDGAQIRPHIVWFGESVPLLSIAIDIVAEADIFIVVGTSLNVYPAASLLNYTSSDCKVYLIDPSANKMSIHSHIETIPKKASEGVVELVNTLLSSSEI